MRLNLSRQADLMDKAPVFEWRDPRFWIPVLLAFLLRLFYLVQLYLDPLLMHLRALDSQVYLEQAREILAGNLLGQGPLFHSGVFYPYLLALVGSRPLNMQILQVFVDTGTCLLLILIARQLFGRRGGLIAGLLYALLTVPIWASAHLLFDTWVTFFIVLGFWFALKLQQQVRPYRWLALGLVCGIAGTAKPFLIGFVPLAWLLIAGPMLRQQRRRALVQGLWALLGVVLVLAPISLRNAMVTGNPSPLPATGGFAFYLGNNPVADGSLIIPRYLGVENSSEAFAITSTRYPSQVLGYQVTPSKASVFWFREGLHFWMDQPATALKLWARKVLLLVNHQELADNFDLGIFKERVGLLRWTIDSGLIIALGLVGLGLALMNVRRHALLLALTTIFFAFLPLFWMSGRFRYPLLALFCLFGALTIKRAAEALARQKWRHLGSLIACFGMALVLSYWPLEIASGEGNRASQLANAQLGLGRPGEALSIVEKVLVSEQSADLLLLQAKILLRLNRSAQAVEPLQVALQLQPTLGEARQLYEQLATNRTDPETAKLELRLKQTPGDLALRKNLARHYLEQQLPGRTIELLTNTSRAGQADDELSFFLAVAYGRMGEIKHSIDIYEQILLRNPGQTLVKANLAFAWLDLMEFKSAQRLFEEVLREDSEQRLALYGMGLCRRFAGDSAGARQYFERFLQVEPPTSLWAQRARAQLR
jgi:tetratricopeptide (TPR) repeat protein